MNLAGKGFLRATHLRVASAIACSCGSVSTVCQQPTGITLHPHTNAPTPTYWHNLARCHFPRSFPLPHINSQTLEPCAAMGRGAVPALSTHMMYTMQKQRRQLVGMAPVVQPLLPRTSGTRTEISTSFTHCSKGPACKGAARRLYCASGAVSQRERQRRGSARPPHRTWEGREAEYLPPY